MIRINKKVEYALMALKHMGSLESGITVSVREMVDLFNCPFDSLSKVLQVLATKGVVISVQGIHGGYSLTKQLKEISIKELVFIIEGPQASVTCLNENQTCNLFEQCNIVSPMQKLEHKLNEFLNKLTLDELLDTSKLKAFEYEKH